VSWRVERWRGSAAAFHAREIPDPADRAVWVFEVDRPALVLGSTQPADHVDTAACAAAGVEVVRRRSGGGAVLLEPGHALWVDVVLPGGSPEWRDDVGAATWWVGEAWVRALATLGVAGAGVHRAGLVTTPWSRRICFAGLGPGEVTVGGAKAVGISQRRTRRAARFQTALSLRWAPATLVGLLAEPRPAASELDGLVHAVGVPPDEALAAFVDALGARI
jgi:lipoate-protein ligase A